MSEIYQWIFLVTVGLAFAVWLWNSRRPKRIPDAQIGRWLDYLSKKLPAGSSKPFRATTATLIEDEYDQIKTLYTPKLQAEWEERYNKMRNEFAVRALETEIESRRAVEAIELNEPLSREDQ